MKFILILSIVLVALIVILSIKNSEESQPIEISDEQYLIIRKGFMAKYLQNLYQQKICLRKLVILGCAMDTVKDNTLDKEIAEYKIKLKNLK